MRQAENALREELIARQRARGEEEVRNRQTISQLADTVSGHVDEMDLADYVAYQIGTGKTKLKWKDQAKGTGRTHGLGGHLGMGDSSAERKARRVFIDDKNGMWPEEYAELLYANMPEGLRARYDDRDVLSAVLDVMRGATSRVGIMQELASRWGSGETLEQRMERERDEWDRQQEEDMREQQEVDEQMRRNDVAATEGAETVVDADYADLIADAQARLNDPNASEFEKQAARTVLRMRSRDGRDRDAAHETDGDVRFRFTGSREEFDKMRDEATKRRGLVMPGLAEKQVRVVQGESQSPFDVSLRDTELKKQVKSYARDHSDEVLGDVEVEGGIVNVSLTSIGEMADPKSYKNTLKNGISKEIHFAVIPKIKEIIGNSIDAEVHPDYLDRDGSGMRVVGRYSDHILMHRLYGAIEIDGQVYRVKTTIKEDKTNNTNRAHTYEVAEIELLESHTGSADRTPTISNNSIVGAKLLQGVEKSYDPGKLLLDESAKTTESGRDLLSRARELKAELNRRGLTNFTLSESKAHGHSVYVEDLETGTKFRLSDHGVTSNARIKNEIHVTANDNVSELADIAEQRQRAYDERVKSFDQMKSETDGLRSYWDGIKDRFAGDTFVGMKRTYQDLDTIKAKHPDARDIRQVDLGGGAYSYEWHEPKQTGNAAERPSIEYMDWYRKNVDESGGVSFRVRDEERRDSDESKKLFDAAKAKFGVTSDIREAGYVLPDGSMLDFSGRHELMGADDSFLRGTRTTDHRGISDVSFVYDKDGNEVKTGVSTDMADFISRGAIRIDNNAGSINLSMAPTREQENVLRRLIANNDGNVWVDFGDGNNTDHYAEYSDARATRVLGDIDRYFSEGIKPEGNLRFRFVGERGAGRADAADRGGRMKNRDTAAEMERAGKDARAIKLATGWERGRDGKWRYEVADDLMDTKAFVDFAYSNPGNNNLLETLIGKDAEIFKYFPSMRGMEVWRNNQGENYYSPKGDYIELDVSACFPAGYEKNLDRIAELEQEIAGFDKYIERARNAGRETLDAESWREESLAELNRLREDLLWRQRMLNNALSHEVQHAIQSKEGFAQGGSPSDFGDRPTIDAVGIALAQADAAKKVLDDGDTLETLRRKYEERAGKTDYDTKTEREVLADAMMMVNEGETPQAIRERYESEADAMWKSYHDDAPDSPFGQYNRLAGEVEARNVSKRMDMSDEERRGSLAEDTEDVPRDEQIVRFGNGVSMMAVDRTTDEYKKKVSDAAKRVEKRLAELHRSDGGEQSPKSNPVGNSADLNSNENYSPDKSGAQSVAQSAAKVNKKLQSASTLAEKMADFISDLPNRTDVTADNFAKVMVDALGLNPMQQVSEYVHYVSQEGDKVTLRVSDHEGNARNIILNGVKTDRGVSIVLRTQDSPEAKFKPNSWAKVDEFVYDNPDKARLTNIAKSIFGMFDSGEYVDLANADEVNTSPREGRASFRYRGDASGGTADHTAAVEEARRRLESADASEFEKTAARAVIKAYGGGGDDNGGGVMYRLWEDAEQYVS